MSNWLHAVSSRSNFVIRNWIISRNIADPLPWNLQFNNNFNNLLKMIVSGTGGTAPGLDNYRVAGLSCPEVPLSKWG